MKAEPLMCGLCKNFPHYAFQDPKGEILLVCCTCSASTRITFTKPETNIMGVLTHSGAKPVGIPNRPEVPKAYKKNLNTET